MTKLLTLYQTYEEYERPAYFTFCFDKLPSKLCVSLPLKDTKENMEKVLGVLNLDELKTEDLCKNWRTEDNKNADFSQDFVCQFFCKSTVKNVVIWVSLSGNSLFIEFLYDGADDSLEQWILACNHRLRTTFGEEKAPVFHVLSKGNGGFYTEEVKTDKFKLDIDQLYNDDFQPVDKIIKTSLTETKAGLILLHGTPGTGKTSYIKSLISEFHETTFIFIQNEFVKELLDPGFVSFLLLHKNSVLIIEDAEKVITKRESSSENSVVSTILQLTDGLFSDYLNIKIICTFNTNIENIDKALLRKGRMIAYYDFKPLTNEKANKLLLSMGHEESSHESNMTLADIFNVKDKAFKQKSSTNKIGFHQ